MLFKRFISGIARRIGFDIDLLAKAESVERLYPGVIAKSVPCIAIQGQYERIRTAAFGRSISKEVSELQGAPREIGPTLRYEIRDVQISQNTVYGRGRRLLYNFKLRSDQTKLPWIEYDHAALRNSFIGCRFFGHWLREDSATHLMAQDFGVPLSMPTPAWPDRAGYLELFGQSYKDAGRAYIRRLTIFDDIHQNEHKAKRWRTLRACVAEKQLRKPHGAIVYIMRGSGGAQRGFANEAEAVESLMRRGVTIVQAETLSIKQLIEQLYGARIIIGVEGSQLTHALFTLTDGGGVLAIQPPDRFFNSHMDWAHALNMRYGIVVGEPNHLGFHLPVDDLLRTIDLMDATLS